ncbi:hypothetical protein ACJX0J_032236 [Zea mays]
MDGNYEQACFLGAAWGFTEQLWHYFNFLMVKFGYYSIFFLAELLPLYTLNGGTPDNHGQQYWSILFWHTVLSFLLPPCVLQAAHNMEWFYILEFLLLAGSGPMFLDVLECYLKYEPAIFIAHSCIGLVVGLAKLMMHAGMESSLINKFVTVAVGSKKTVCEEFLTRAIQIGGNVATCTNLLINISDERAIAHNGFGHDTHSLVGGTYH